MSKTECSFCSSEVPPERVKQFCPYQQNTTEYDICEFCYTSVPPNVMSNSVPYQKETNNILMHIWLAAARVANYHLEKLADRGAFRAERVCRFHSRVRHRVCCAGASRRHVKLGRAAKVA